MCRDRKPFVAAHLATSRCNAEQATQSFLSACSPAQPLGSSSAVTSLMLFSPCPARAQVVRPQPVATWRATMPDRRRRRRTRSDAVAQTQTGWVQRIVRAIEIPTIDPGLRLPVRRRRRAQLRRQNLHRRLQQSRVQAQRQRQEFHRSWRSREVRRHQARLSLRRKQPGKA